MFCFGPTFLCRNFEENHSNFPKKHLNNLTVIYFFLPPFLILNQQQLVGTTPSWKVVSYNTAMGATATADAWQMTLELFQHDGTQGDQISYSSAMTCGRFRWRGVQIGGFCGKTTLEGTQLMIKKKHVKGNKFRTVGSSILFYSLGVALFF